MQNGIVTRFAPTPSGFLHIGNAHNFILTWWIAKTLGGKILLRIDDADHGRRRKEFLDDIFESLEWLGLDWDRGPRNTQDFLANHSQSLKKEIYFSALQEARDLFACDCSRKKIKEASADGGYPGFCREKGKVFTRGERALRLRAPDDIGDFIVWRKDDVPAYHLTSVVDDDSEGVNLIVRGEDLLESSKAQKYLATKIGKESFLEAKIIHHPLILGDKGEKISKSSASGAGSYTLKGMRENGVLAHKVYEAFGKNYGLDEKEINGPRDLLTRRPPYLN